MPLDNKYTQNYQGTTASGIAETDSKKVLNEYSNFNGFLLENAPPQFKPRDNELETVRILPRFDFEPNEPKHFSYAFAAHYFKHVQATCICSAKKYGRCPSCEENKYIAFAPGGPKNTKAAATYRVSPSYAVYVIDMNKQSEGVKLWILTPNVKDLIDGQIKSEATGAINLIDHPLTGSNICFKKGDSGKKFSDENGNPTNKPVMMITKIEVMPSSPLNEEFGNTWLEFVTTNPIKKWFKDSTPDEIAEMAKITPESRQQDSQNFAAMAANVLQQKSESRSAVHNPDPAPLATPNQPAEVAKVEIPATPAQSVPDKPPATPDALKPPVTAAAPSGDAPMSVAEKMAARRRQIEEEKKAKG